MAARQDKLARVASLMDEAAPPATRQEHLDGRARLVAAVEEMRRPSRAPRFVAVGALAAAAAVAVFIGWKARAPKAIAFEVENGSVGAQGYVSIPAGAPNATLRFTDGSDVALTAGSRSRVAMTTADGAELVLEQGRALVHVEHKEHTRWIVDAGPYAVHVTGTRFTVAWSPNHEALDVTMKEGRVVVNGPQAESIAIVAGQHLHAGPGGVRIDNASDDESAANAPVPSIDDASAPSSIDIEDASINPMPSYTPRTSWAKLVSTGDYDRVLREAHSEGDAHALAHRSLPDLRALGDAARYSDDVPYAKRAYGAMRGRFGSSAEGHTAAFLLGRVAEEKEGTPSKALEWYRTYLNEAPSGAFAGDALGRTMALTAQASGAAAARPYAEQYLRRFPKGPYASAARNLAP